MDVSTLTDMPFQIAYAVSIHKAQGLEYDSVKVIITKDVDEMITHNAFYTAILQITRAKKALENILESRITGKKSQQFRDYGCKKGRFNFRCAVTD